MELRSPSAAELAHARVLVARWLAPTPLLPTTLRQEALLKLETCQPIGAFKVRGALAALSSIPSTVRAVSASAGNHALGMAYAAQLTGRRATVVVAESASPAKIAALRRFPIEVVVHGPDYDAAEAYAREMASTAGTVYVSAYSHPAVIAGQATVGSEIAVQLGAEAAGPLTLVCPLGGGGLAAGLVLWAREHGDARVIAVEAEASRAASAAVAAGRIVTVPVGDTLADGLAGNLEPGCPNPALLHQAVKEGMTTLTTVSEEQLAAAMRWLFTNHGLVVEGAGAAGVAALLGSDLDIHGRLVVVLTGRNIAPALYARVLDQPQAGGT